ncbi:MAG: nodulation protein NfeD [Flavisolibacter sp.]|nr:nodulation protein NfeD [Flavisolibacter sp.]
MNRYLFFYLLLLSLPFCVKAQNSKVFSITVDGSINPSSANFIERSIKKATAENAEAVLIHLNTPGGLLKSTRVIVGHILESEVPVIVYVSPGGAHAGSAGVFITMAAHVAAMAPGTNIGAAHPVSMQGGTDSTMNTKATNDAVAFIKTIAQKRNRNSEWAEEAVTKSVSITGSEALDLNVIDMIAVTTNQLLNEIDGRTVEVNSGSRTISTRQTQVQVVEMSFIEKILNIISDPNIAYILLMLGFYGLLFELYSPGAIFPGVIGGLGLILGFYALAALPLNYAGLALIIFGIVLFVLEIKVTSYGILTIGGVVSLLLGSLMLIKEETTFEVIRISTSVIITTTALTTLFFLFLIGAGLKAQKGKPVTGIEGFIGEVGVVLEDLDPEGTVRVHGEIWRAASAEGKLQVGERIKVVSMQNFKLIVEKV